MKRRKTRTLTGCHRCGAPFKKVSGMIRCSACGHVPQGWLLDDGRPRDEWGRIRMTPDPDMMRLPDRDLHPTGNREQPLTGRQERWLGSGGDKR